MACYYPQLNTIYIKGNPEKPEEICYDELGQLNKECAETFYHELMHFIFDYEADEFKNIGYSFGNIISSKSEREENLTWYMDYKVSSITNSVMGDLEAKLNINDCDYQGYLEKIYDYLEPTDLSGPVYSLADYIAGNDRPCLGECNDESVPQIVLEKLDELFGFNAIPKAMENGYKALNCGDCVDQPTDPTILATDLIYPTFITIDQNNVYWPAYWPDEGVSIKKIPLNGGVISILKEGTFPKHITNIAVDGSSVYWSETLGGGSGWINKIPITGGTMTTLTSSANHPYDIAIDSTHVYWTEKISGTPSFVQVRKVPIDGGTRTPLTESLYGFFFTGIAIDNDNVYFAYLRPNSSVYYVAKVSKNGGAVTPLFSSSNYKTDVEVDSTHVYWIEITQPGPGEIKRIPIDGGQEDTLATGLNDPQWIVVDSENVYWTEFANGDSGAGAIKSVPVTGGTVTTLADELNGPYDLAVDDNYVYWTEQGTDGTDGMIRKISKNAP